MNQIQQLNREIDQLLKRPSIDSDVKEWANEELDEIQPLIDLVLRPNGFESFLVDYLNHEREKFVCDPENHPYDENRVKPLCLCENTSCSLLYGDLPARVSRYEDIHQGIIEMRRTHRGDPIALREAEDEWRDIRREVITTQRRVIRGLSDGQPVDRDGEAPVSGLTAFA